MIFLSLHALQRMERRHISRAEVIEALADVTATYPSDDAPDQKIVKLGATRAGRPLKIVVLVADPEYIVTVADRSQEG